MRRGAAACGAVPSPVCGVFADFRAVLLFAGNAAVIAADIPIGFLDAYAACWTAARIAEGTAIRTPAAPEVDVKRLRMEMWY